MGYMRYHVAAIQFEPQLGRVEENVARILALCEEAARRGCRLLVLPEMATSGYCFYSRKELAPFVEPIPGPSTERLGRLAAQHGCYIVIGLPEVDLESSIFYNSAALIGPRGLVGKMRKVHLYVADTPYAAEGNLGFPVWPTEIGRIAVQVCMDASYPEATRVAALQGADVVCLPTNDMGQRAPTTDWLTRAFESGVYFVAANRYGLERGVQFIGGSCVLGPDGEMLAVRDGGDGIVEAEVDLVRTRERRFAWDAGGDKLRERRPQWYGDLALSPLLWPMREARDIYNHRPLPAGGRCGVAVVQTAGAPDRPAQAREWAENLVCTAVAEADATIDLVVLPELALVSDPRRADECAEPLPGPTSEWAATLARKLGLHLALGLPERATDRLYNSAALIGPEGVVGVYRKLHLGPFDRPWAAPGDAGLRVWDLPMARVGLLIGHDAMFPEASRCLAVQGADLICAPSAVRGPLPRDVPDTEIPLPAEVQQTPCAAYWHLWRVRAGENNSYLAFANRSDHGCMGWSGIFGPDLYCFPREERVIAGPAEGAAGLVIDSGDYPLPNQPNLARFKELIRMRRPQFYEALLT